MLGFFGFPWGELGVTQLGSVNNTRSSRIELKRLFVEFLIEYRFISFSVPLSHAKKNQQKERNKENSRQDQKWSINVFPGHIAQVQPCHYTNAKEESLDERLLFYYMRAHNRLPIPQGFNCCSDYRISESLSQLGMDKCPDVSSSAPTRGATSAWCITWLNK